MPVIKSLRQKSKQMMSIFTHARACFLGQGGSSSATSSLLWFCHSQAGRLSRLVHFPTLNMSLPGKILPDNTTASILHFVCCSQQKADKNRAAATRRKSQKLIQQMFREEYMNKYPCIVKSSLWTHSKTAMYGVLTSLSLMSECMTL